MIKLKINTSALRASQNNSNNSNKSASVSSAGAGATGAASADSVISSSPPPPISANSPASAASPSVVPKIRFKNLKKPGNTSKASTAPSTPASKVNKASATTTKASTTKLKPIITALANNNEAGAIHTPITLKTPKLKLKAAPVRPKKRHFEPGLGYDSEASDREDDPLIEEQFILRMKPGPDCDFLREVIESKQLDHTTDVWFKFKENRKAVVCVRGNMYAALLVDLPCIVESSKTIDKKAIFKTADICQMLLVGDRISNEDAIFGIHYKPADLIYPHGLTPPLQYVRKRRFRKRVSNRTIEAVEAEVDRLLALDQEAENSRYELLDAEQLMQEEAGDEGYNMLGQAGGDTGRGGAGVGDGYNDEDAEGEDDYDMDEDDLALQMESALMGGDADADAEGEIDEDAVMTALNGTTSSSIGKADTGATGTQGESEDEEDEEEEEDEDASDAEGEADDESAQETAAQSQKIREEIADLEAAYKSGLREIEKMQNPIMKQRKQAALERIVKELEFKRSTVGIGNSGVGL